MALQTVCIQSMVRTKWPQKHGAQKVFMIVYSLWSDRLNFKCKWLQTSETRRRYLWHWPFKKSRMRTSVRKLTPELRSQKNSEL